MWGKDSRENKGLFQIGTFPNLVFVLFLSSFCFSLFQYLYSFGSCHCRVFVRTFVDLYSNKAGYPT